MLDLQTHPPRHSESSVCKRCYLYLKEVSSTGSPSHSKSTITTHMSRLRQRNTIRLNAITSNPLSIILPSTSSALQVNVMLDGCRRLTLESLLFTLAPLLPRKAFIPSATTAPHWNSHNLSLAALAVFNWRRARHKVVLRLEGPVFQGKIT
ncbi:hypothetical protein BDV19DRAFT_392356 [Aspergillus venezuelensis]